MGEGVCVRLELVSVCGGRWVDGWLGRSVLLLLMPSSQKPPTGSVHATSVAASRVEQALSEVASSLQSSAPKQGPLHPWMTLAQIWLHAGMALHPPPSPHGRARCQGSLWVLACLPMTPLWRVFEKSKQSQVRMPQLLAGTMSSSVSPHRAPEPGTG